MERDEFIDGIVQQFSAAMLTKPEAVLLVSELLQRIVGGDATTVRNTPQERERVEQSKETAPFTPKSIKYDPMYDPAPPFDVEKVPERVETPSRILAAQNTACICNACKKVVYITNKSIMDGMKVADFIAAYTPTAGMKPLDRTMEIQNFDGNIACDCVACGASKQLFLTGGPRA
jgi:hypothetical protein